MKKIVFLIFVATTVTNIDADFRADYKFYNEIHGYLKYQEIPANFSEAHLRCHLEGAKLASPISPEMKMAMLKTINLSNGSTVLTGFHSLFSNGYFFSIEGVPLAETSHSWSGGNPNQETGEERCIVMLGQNYYRKAGFFDTVNCTRKFSYMCYKKDTLNDLSVCNTSDTEYFFESETGRCYKVHGRPLTWYQAYQTCAAEGGYLAVIHNETETNVLAEQLRNHAHPLVDWTYHVGFLDWDKRGEWLTIHDDAMTDVHRQPDALQQCGALRAYPWPGTGQGYKLDSINCMIKTSFICEKDPRRNNNTQINTFFGGNRTVYNYTNFDQWQR